MALERSPVSSDVDLEADGKQLSYLRVPYSRNTSAWGSLLVPITVVKNGAGPTVFLVGGNHGGEYEGPVCLLKLSRELEPEDVQGRVIIMPALNLPAVQAGQRLSPLDGKDMNRVFPGRWDGTITEIVAHYVHEAILPLCDAVIDLHSGGYSLVLAPYISMHYLADEEQREKTWAAMMAFQAPVALVMNEISGPGLLDYAVERMGKVFLCAELGSAGTLSPETLEITEVGTRNILRHFGVIDGEPITRQERGASPTRVMEMPDPDCYHMALSPGIYESFLELGDWAQAAEPLGQIHNVQRPGEEPAVVLAQRDGMPVGRRGPGYVEVGDTVAALAIDHDR
jgi:N-alpha-acetyl-L-2,4-diaminobutyrate deacetylase